MISVSDIVKLLEQVPIWRSLVGMPKRIADLEARVAALEGGKPSAAPGPTDCPMCRAPMRITGERAHPTHSPMGFFEHAMRCDGCGRETTRRFHPAKGYV